MKAALPVLLAIAALVPFALHSQFLIDIAMLTAISAALGQAWNLVGGFGGLTSFGHVAFFGFGAYAAAILQIRYGANPWLGLPLGALLGGGVGAAMGWAAFRAGLRGSYFALATLAMAEAFRILANSLTYTHAGLGLLVPLRVGLANFQFADRRFSYGLALILVLLTAGAARWLTRSRFGAQLIAVRENEDAARALGVKVVRTKTCWPSPLSGSGDGAGRRRSMRRHTSMSIPNIAFGTERSVEMLLVAMIGGRGHRRWGLSSAPSCCTRVADTSATSGSIVPGLAPMLYGVVLLADHCSSFPAGSRALRGRVARG